MKQANIFLDGEMIAARADLIDSLAPGNVDGKGVFETMRVYNGRIFALEEHLARMRHGLKAMSMRLPYSDECITDNLYQTIRANKLKEARIRLAVWQQGRQRRTAIVAQSFGGEWERKYQSGMTAMISSVIRPGSKYSNVKSLDYGCFRNALREARSKGFDEAILLNAKGSVVEGSRTNIFYVYRGILYTPPVSGGCLNGITRQFIRDIARREKIEQKTEQARAGRIISADEVFVTNSLMGVMPLRSINRQRIGTGQPGTITKKLHRAYNLIVHSSCPGSRDSI